MDKVADSRATVSIPLDLTVIAEKVAAILDGKQEACQGGYLNVATALDFLGWGIRGRDRLYDYIAADAIPFHKVGRRYFFDRDELREWVTSSPASPNGTGRDDG